MGRGLVRNKDPREGGLRFSYNVIKHSRSKRGQLMSDDAELVKAGVEGFTAASLAPFTDLVSRLFGRAADEGGAILGEIVHDFGSEYRKRRQSRTVRVLQRTQDFLTVEGATAKQVEMKLLMPLLENGSLEEDDGLQDRWAALLARTSTGTRIPGAVEILKQLTSHDVELLQLCYDHVHNIETTVWKEENDKICAGAPMPPPPPFDPTSYALADALGKWKWRLAERLNHPWRSTGKYGQPEEFYSFLDNVIRLGLITPADERLTRIGYGFISACQIPS
jgi:hypothetical protein